MGRNVRVGEAQHGEDCGRHPGERVNTNNQEASANRKPGTQYVHMEREQGDDYQPKLKEQCP